MRELTYSELAQVEDALQTEAALQMDEGSFRAFYNRTARALWAYLAKVTGDSAAADDLMQECYYRFLRTRHAAMSEEQAKPYLFRIATNLLRDHWRRGQGRVNVPLDEMEEVPTGERTAHYPLCDFRKLARAFHGLPGLRYLGREVEPSNSVADLVSPFARPQFVRKQGAAEIAFRCWQGCHSDAREHSRACCV